MQGTLTALILVNGASALLVALHTGWRGIGTSIAAGTAIVLAVAALPPDLFMRTFVINAPEQIAYYREGATDTVGVIESFGQRFIRYEDMRGTAGTMSYRVNYFLGHLPM